MPRRVNADEREEAVELIPAGSDYEGEASPGDASEQWSEFEQFRDQAESDRRGMLIWVYRIPTDAQGIPVTGGETSLLFTAPIDTYPSLPTVFDRVKKEYMPRGYGRALIRIQVRREKKTGVLWQKVFTIEKGARDDEPEAVGKIGGDIAALAAIFQRTLEAQQQQNRELIARILSAQNQAGAVDPMGQARGIIEMVTAITAAINSGKPAAALAAPQTLGEMAGGFREMLKLSREFGNPGVASDEDEGGVVGVLKAASPFADMIKELIVQARQNPNPYKRHRSLPCNPIRAFWLNGGGGCLPSVRQNCAQRAHHQIFTRRRRQHRNRGMIRCY